MEEKQAIAFAFYRNGELLGYRADTVGTISKKFVKIYHYSPEQVETCLTNIRHNVKNSDGIGKALESCFGKDPLTDLISEGEKKIHDTLQDARAFEVRVVKCPGYPKVFDVNKAEYVIDIWEYPTEEINAWKADPDSHEVIETHYFSFDGQLNLQ